MHLAAKVLSVVLVLAGLASAATAEPPAPDPHLAPLAPFVGKTWKGNLAGPAAGTPVWDVSRWEWALKGKAARNFHATNGGEYGGETLVVWDEEKKSLVYFYFTTAGHYTTGTMTVDNGKYQAHERVVGNQRGVTEIRSTGEVLASGKLRVRAEMLRDGEWHLAFEAEYAEDSSAKVVLD